MPVSRRDPFDELGVGPGASDDEIQRAYERRVVERHRLGVFSIVDQLRHLQRAFRALSEPAARESHLRERQRRDSHRASDHAAARSRQLALLHSYKARMSRDLARIGAANTESYAAELAEIERRIAREEADSRRLARRQRLARAVRSSLLLALVVGAAVALWLRLHGT